MKLIAFFTLVALLAVNGNVNIKKCSDKPSFITNLQVIDKSGSSKITKDSVLFVKFDNSRNFNVNEEIKAKISAKIYVLFGYVSVPTTLIDMLAKQMKPTDPVKYLGQSTFQLGCPALSKVLPTCPPLVGQNEITKTMNKHFIKINEALGKLGGVFASWISSGWYKITIDVKTTSDEPVACYTAEFEVKL